MRCRRIIGGIGLASNGRAGDERVVQRAFGQLETRKEQVSSAKERRVTKDLE
jgi:hypothetical protein